MALPDRHDEAATDLELVVERVRDVGRGRSDRDRVEGRLVGQTARPVADVDLDVVDPAASRLRRACSASSGIRSMECTSCASCASTAA